jgi:hypothetical protein
MATIPANLRLITATIKVGADDYTAHIQDFQYVPNASTVEVTDVSGKVSKFSGEAGWDLTLNVFQDFTTTGLARKMFNDEGDQFEIVIVDGPNTYTSTVTLVAPAIGGATKAVGVSSVTLPSSKPVITATA